MTHELYEACKALLDAPHYEHFAVRLNDRENAALDRIKAEMRQLEHAGITPKFHASHLVERDQCLYCMVLAHESGADAPCPLAPEPKEDTRHSVLCPKRRSPNAACIETATGIRAGCFPPDATFHTGSNNPTAEEYRASRQQRTASSEQHLKTFLDASPRVIPCTPSHVHIHLLMTDDEADAATFGRAEFCCHGCGVSAVYTYHWPKRPGTYTEIQMLRERFARLHADCPPPRSITLCPTYRARTYHQDLRRGRA